MPKSIELEKRVGLHHNAARIWSCWRCGTYRPIARKKGRFTTSTAKVRLDVLECPRCGSRMRILAAIEDPVVARKILDSLGLPSRSPPVSPARRNPQPTLTEFW